MKVFHLEVEAEKLEDGQWVVKTAAGLQLVPDVFFQALLPAPLAAKLVKLAAPQRTKVAPLPNGKPKRKLRQAKPAPIARATKKTRGGGRSGMLKPDVITRAKAMWLDPKVPVASIGPTFGKSQTWAYNLASKHEWPSRVKVRRDASPPRPSGRRDPGHRRKPVDLEAPPIPGKARTCRECDRTTMADPCDYCGTTAVAQ